MPHGKMSITLDDVGTILEILVTGKLVSTDSLSIERVVSLVSSALGVSPEDAHNELLGAPGNSMMLKWFRNTFGEVYDANPEPQIRNAMRAFFLYILGCTLFTDKSDTRVLVIYMRFVDGLGWGAYICLGCFCIGIFVYIVETCYPDWRQVDSWVFDPTWGLNIKHFRHCYSQLTIHEIPTSGASLGSPEWVWRLHGSFANTSKALDTLRGHEVIW